MQDTAGSMTFPMSEVKQKSPSSNVCDNTGCPVAIECFADGSEAFGREKRLGQVDLVNRPDKAH
jgi:hypothetical protein